ncbi:iron complex transport system ATP-binding protein [Tranquillimonas rosea]|uniref:Iron complex transport system ATP-binding protein n=1 Tax=Tranquillimonas rosea TaxID=641238 RepID=A0A1H9RGH6_9RHOB|nr:ABC transporter ATP-binding protein [Tranquillimonas rosea]SER71764.1 iron complex transport system ATP-binding protein [Tranquillimonas rosea]
MTVLSLDALSVSLRGRPVLRDATLSVGAGELVGLIGPNGAGKTTLMRAALGLLGARGRSSLAALPARERARTAAWMPQSREIAWPVTVETLVMLGRLPHMAGGQRPAAADHASVDRALARMELDPLRHRTATRLSGGEQARVLIARALAQETPLILADEPIAGLDPAYQIATMQTFAGLAASGHAVVVSLHDLPLAARHCTRLVMMDRGRIVADGAPDAVLTPERLAEVFHVRALHRQTEEGPIFQPIEVIR